MDKENKLPYSFRITPELKEKLKKAAQKEEVSEGMIINRALENYFIWANPYAFLDDLITSREKRIQFMNWLKKQPVFLQKRFRDTDDPEEAADIITRFKQSVKSVQSVKSDNQ